MKSQDYLNNRTAGGLRPRQDKAKKVDYKKKFKELMNTDTMSARHGTAAVTISILVICIVLVLNLIFQNLPTSITEFDISSQKLYTITEISKLYLEDLKEDVDLIMVAQPSGVDERIIKFVDNYAALSDKVTVVWEDPVENPAVLTDYNCEEDVLVVKCVSTGKFTVIPFMGAYEGIISYEIDTQNYTGEGEPEAVETAFDGEGQITSAIDYVVNDAEGLLYTLTNHGERELPKNLVNRLKKTHLAISETPVDLLNNPEIPADCGLLVIYAPTADLSEKELQIITDYLHVGGDLFLVLDPGVDPTNINWDRENFDLLLAEYGVKVQKGFVGDQTKYLQQYYDKYGYYVFSPTLSTTSDITSKINSNLVSLVVQPHGMTSITPDRAGISIDKFLTTSESGILVNGEVSSKNLFFLGAEINETVNDASGKLAKTTITLYSSANFCSDDLTTDNPNLANLDIMVKSFTSHFDNISSEISIPAKSLLQGHNTVSNYGLLVVATILPIVAVLVGGLFFWLKRRKK